MASTYTDATRNALVDTLCARGAFVSLHTADPGITGASECSGGTYVRVATTWGTASSGARVGSAVTIGPGTGQTATFWGVWSAASGGTFVGGGTLSSNMSAAANLTVTQTV